MRIISGLYKSRQLKGSPPPGTRPTSDKLRETLFNVLGESVRGCTFLDGCAGVGAIGIEAISRGAAMVAFVDQSRKAARMIRENLRALGIESGFKIFELSLDKALAVCARDEMKFDISFIDPPYDRDDVYRHSLRQFAELPVLAAEGLLVVEHSKRKELPDVEGRLTKVRTLVQGDSTLSFFRAEVV